MPIGGVVSAEPTPAQPHFTTANEKDAQGNAVVDPNTFATTIKYLWDSVDPVAWGQLLPLPKAVGGSGADNPLFPVNIMANLAAVKKDAQARLAKGDHIGAYAKYVESVIPVLGPILSQWGDDAQANKWMKLLGEVGGFALNLKGGMKATDMMKAQFPLADRVTGNLTPPAAQTAIDFAKARDIPLDAATATDNVVVKGAQTLADNTLGGSLVATKANAARTAAMTSVGEDLAGQAHPVPVTAEQVGTGLRDALTAKMGEHHAAANTAYDTLRIIEGLDSVVDLRPVKASLRAVYEQMQRQMPITQQQANPGLKAIQNILEGPATGPLSQVDRDLSAIKTVAREQGGLAKMAVAKLEAAVTTAAEKGGPDVVGALQRGRAATIAKYATEAVVDKLKVEPVKTFEGLTAPKDSAIQALRTVAQQVPDQVPVVARAYLEDLLQKPQKVADWRKLGAETKRLLFPKAGQTAALDHFFELTDRISKTNVNPSGSGRIAWMGGQGMMFIYDPVRATTIQVAGATVAKLLRTPAVVDALTRGISLPSNAPLAAQTAATANLFRAAHSAGVHLALPTAADPTAPANQPIPPAR